MAQEQTFKLVKNFFLSSRARLARAQHGVVVEDRSHFFAQNSSLRLTGHLSGHGLMVCDRYFFFPLHRCVFFRYIFFPLSKGNLFFRYIFFPLHRCVCFSPSRLPGLHKTVNP